MVYKVGKWNLRDLVDEKDIDNKLKGVDQKVKRFESFKNKLKSDVDAAIVNEMLVLSEDISRNLIPVMFYADLGFQANNKSERFIQISNKLKQKSTEMSNRMRFFDTWWKDLDDKNAQRIIQKLTLNKYAMQKARELRKYVLKEEEEKIIAIKDNTGSQALNELYAMMKSDFDFRFRGKRVTEQDLMNHMLSIDQKTRRDAFTAMLETYKAHAIPLGHLYQTLVNDYVKENIELRKYDSPLTVRALHDDLPVESINMLMKVTKKNNHLFTEFFKLKQKITKLKDPKIYDLLAPYPVKEKTITYDNAIKLILEVFGEFDPEFRKHAQTIIDKQHIDSETRKDKYPSAFCSSSPSVIPYILMNYKNKEDDVRTLIHELGHGVHALLASHHTTAESHSTPSLAETASISSEHLLFDKELREEKDKKRKIAKLTTILNDISASVQRQMAFSEFEQRAHDSIAKGGSLEDLNQLWLKIAQEYYGDAAEIPELYKYGWTRIPHFYHWPFYVYSYAFANILVLSLMKRYKKEGKSFVPKFKKILAYGSSKAPKDILKEVGIDITSEQFWQQGFDMIREYLDELKQLA